MTDEVHHNTKKAADIALAKKAISSDSHGAVHEGRITVEDDGKGMGPAREGGLGLTLIDSFAQQLNGRVERDAVEKGTRTRVCFPLLS